MNNKDREPGLYISSEKIEHVAKLTNRRNKMKEATSVFLNNAKTFHHRIMARFLRKRKWVVFYLPPEQRVCKKGSCWLKLSEQ